MNGLDALLFIFSFWGIAFTFGLGVHLTINWFQHKKAVRDRYPIFGYGSYKDFKGSFFKYKLKQDRWSRGEYESENGLSSVEDDRYCFNSIGMIIRDPISLFFVKRFIKKRKFIPRLSFKQLETLIEQDYPLNEDQLRLIERGDETW